MFFKGVRAVVLETDAHDVHDFADAMHIGVLSEEEIDPFEAEVVASGAFWWKSLHDGGDVGGGGEANVLCEGFGEDVKAGGVVRDEKSAGNPDVEMTLCEASGEEKTGHIETPACLFVNSRKGAIVVHRLAEVREVGHKVCPFWVSKNCELVVRIAL